MTAGCQPCLPGRRALHRCCTLHTGVVKEAPQRQPSQHSLHGDRLVVNCMCVAIVSPSFRRVHQLDPPASCRPSQVADACHRA